MEWSNELIADLIGCPKTIAQGPSKEMRVEQGTRRNGMKLLSADGERAYTVFMRVNDAFPENFSIGLVFLPKDEARTYVLLRYNGPHGAVRLDLHEPVYHAVPHKHKATNESISSGRRPECNVELTQSYVSYEEALAAFVRDVNITNIEQFMPDLLQLKLDFRQVDGAP